MRTIKYSFAAFVLLSLISCGKFLSDYQPRGVVTAEDLKTADNVESLTNAAYASLANGNWFVPYENMWLFGSVRSDDTYKGGLGQSDQSEMNAMELFNILQPSNPRLDQLWTRLYIGVWRANFALEGLQNVDENSYPMKKNREGEMRFLRGHFYFLLKELFNHIPYVTPGMDRDAIQNVSNVEFTSDELWDKIAEDFEFATNNLPNHSPEIGRPDKYAAEAYLAKVRLYQAYRQDANNQVVSINTDNLNEVVQLTGDIMNLSGYGLVSDYAEKYLYEFDNNIESIWAIQYSMNDGTSDNRAEREGALNYPMNDAYGCCSFNRPTQNLVNAYQTTSAGLPLFESFNDYNLNTTEDFQTHSFDPRIDHTVGIPGHPYKYQNDMIYDADIFARALNVYGPFSGMKGVYQAGCTCAVEVQGGAFLGSTKTDVILSYDDVVLWRAEALIQLNRQDEATPLINLIRDRALNSTGRLKHDDGSSYSNYKLDIYKPGINITWDKETAFKALQWERRLEFATESPRFFDLVRWGIASEVMNEYFEKEKSRFPFLASARFVAGRDEYFPIPDAQIILSDGVYKPNPGY